MANSWRGEGARAPRSRGRGVAGSRGRGADEDRRAGRLAIDVVRRVLVAGHNTTVRRGPSRTEAVPLRKHGLTSLRVLCGASGSTSGKGVARYRLERLDQPQHSAAPIRAPAGRVKAHPGRADQGHDAQAWAEQRTGRRDARHHRLPGASAGFASCGPLCWSGWYALHKAGSRGLRGAGQARAGSSRSRASTSGKQAVARWQAWRISRPGRRSAAAAGWRSWPCRRGRFLPGCPDRRCGR